MVKARMPTSKPTRKLQAGGLAGAISAPSTTVLIYVVEKIINEPLPGEVAGAIGSIIAIVAVLVAAYVTAPSLDDTPVAE